ncbi:cystatin-B-like [Engystomops pustulosus]|uniref:cystatin-B-like n=1 Tax=Engystomops pustulosus TaxID=76066 RepID=UPI003AFA1F18
MATSHIALLFLVSVIAEHRTYGEKNQLPGSLGPELPATEHVQDLCDEVKHQFLEQSNVKVEFFEASRYRKQIVSGTNYFVKVRIAWGQYVHLRIYEPLPITKNKPRLDAFLLEKRRNDPINYFPVNRN